ncbi:MAG TPA: ABC transporter permease [Coriobacteriia bacterium]
MSAPRRILAVGRKEFIHISRDWRILVSVLLMPVIQLLLFSYAISFDVKNVATVVLDQDRSAASREMLSHFERSDFFRVVAHVGSDGEVDAYIARSQARVAIVVPPGFGRDLTAGRKPAVQVLVDGSEPNSAQLGQTYAAALTQTLSQQVTLEWAQVRGLDPSAAGQLMPRLRTWYNPERKSADFLIPGLMVVIIMIVTIQQTAVTLVREKDQGTFEQLTVSPIRRGELMLGKVAPWVALGLIDVVVITLVGVLVFGIPLRGSILTLALASFLFVLCCLSLGLIISSRAPSLETANFLGLMVAFLPGFMLSGFAFPLNSIPVPLQWASYLFPARYMTVITRAVFLKGAGLTLLAPEMIALVIYAVVGLTVASLLWARRAD